MECHENTAIAITQSFSFLLWAKEGSGKDLQVDYAGGAVCAKDATASATMMLCNRIMLKIMSFDDLARKIEIRNDIFSWKLCR